MRKVVIGRNVAGKILILKIKKLLLELILEVIRRERLQ